MQYVSKEAVLAAVKDWTEFFSKEIPVQFEPDQVIDLLKDEFTHMSPEIDTELDITELLYREKREPIRVRAGLMLCPTCRKQLKEGHSYCKKCGQAILKEKGDNTKPKN